jgi:hypothetical protein
MATKTNINQFAELSQQLGLVLMSAAVTFGMLETPDRSGRVVLPTQPVFARVAENDQNQNTLRRESEETEQHYISYSVAQRTPSRSGKH